MSQRHPAETSALSLTDTVYNVYEDGLKIHVVDTVQAHLALLAMDRQCGNCHHPNRSTNKAALAIFDLAEECWYCPLNLHQATEIRKRTKSTKFSDDEQAAIASLLDRLTDPIK